MMLLMHPEMQRVAHEEIDRVVGRDRLPTIEDQESLPYTIAFIKETRRYVDHGQSQDI